jgi:cell division protein ZapA
MAKAELIVADKRYALSCAPGQEARLEELGARFDARVSELKEALGDIGAERLFLAAGRR